MSSTVSNIDNDIEEVREKRQPKGLLNIAEDDNDSLADAAWNYDFDENILNEDEGDDIFGEEIMVNGSTSRSSSTSKKLDSPLELRNTNNSNTIKLSPEISAELEEADDTLESIRVNAPTPIKAMSFPNGNNTSDVKTSSSLSSHSSLTPIGIKSHPANPETTKEDIISTSFTPSDSMNDSILNSEHLGLSVTKHSPIKIDTKMEENPSVDSTMELTPTPTSPSNGFMSTLRSISSTFSGAGPLNGSNGSLSSPIPNKTGTHSRSNSELSLDSPSTPNNQHQRYASNGSIIYEEDEDDGSGHFQEIKGPDGQPNIISYRRTNKPRRQRAHTNGSTPKSPEIGAVNEEEYLQSPSRPTTQDFDRNLYVDEKYLDTQYRFATLKRNMDFHELFKTMVPEDDRLLDDFSCALSREILLQGRLYVSEHYLCFNSNILGWVTSVVVSHDDIVSFEKKVTAGLFANGIIVETKDAKHSFATFVSRDSTFNFLETVWSRSLALSERNNEPKRETEISVGPLSFPSNGRSKNTLDESDIYSVDDEAPEDLSSSVKQVLKVPKRETQFEYSNDGPDTHPPTKIDFDCKAAGETLLFDEVYSVPVGLMFNILFGENTKFHQKLMSLSQGSDFSDYSEFKNSSRDDAIQERSFTYERSLGYSIGPKSTRVECTELIIKKDYDSTIEVLTITKTPNVPSGGAFSVNTRYIFSWAENNQTRFHLSFKANWTGRSFIRGVIDGNILTGQQTVAKTTQDELKKLLAGYKFGASKSDASSCMDDKLSISESTPERLGKEDSQAEKLEPKVTTLEEPNTKTFTNILITSFKDFAFSEDAKYFLVFLVIFVQLYSIAQLRNSNQLLIQMNEGKEHTLRLVLAELREIKENLSFGEVYNPTNE